MRSAIQRYLKPARWEKLGARNGLPRKKRYLSSNSEKEIIIEKTVKKKDFMELALE